MGTTWTSRRKIRIMASHDSFPSTLLPPRVLEWHPKRAARDVMHTSTQHCRWAAMHMRRRHQQRVRHGGVDGCPVTSPSSTECQLPGVAADLDRTSTWQRWVGRDKR
ncbi:hypothetical protein H310_12738 [Aphanomyces invadans]|uniref:Uncharacterized protein n=1 Tax=Aphanomyces invadans TaxID=157072 RepID=A0A024THQ7_9STRA|nr:hypothetical protein H310_12738 [Aphanomyces invadans]ETV93126.1 hypothetical protein H310_12738 [Aphanomyces invadans]|eukprot:XP_008878148.1 hypothetical protein H310_12738 [Aphanomyces invadans]